MLIGKNIFKINSINPINNICNILCIGDNLFTTLREWRPTMKYKISLIALALFLITCLYGCQKTKAKKEVTKQIPNNLSQFNKKTEEMMLGFERFIDLNIKINENEGAHPDFEKNKNALQKTSDQTEYENKQKADFATLSSEWEKIKGGNLELHNLWNGLSINLSSAMVPSKTLKEFSDILNSLTIDISKNDAFNSELRLNEFYKYYSEFYSKFDSKITPDFYKMIYYVRDVYFLAQSGNYDKAKTDMDNISLIWEPIKNNLPNSLNDGIKLVVNSISELSSALKSKDVKLIKIKTDILLKDINNLMGDEMNLPSV